MGGGKPMKGTLQPFCALLRRFGGFLCAVLPINHESQPIGPIGYAEEVSLFSTNEVSL